MQYVLYVAHAALKGAICPICCYVAHAALKGAVCPICCYVAHAALKGAVCPICCTCCLEGCSMSYMLHMLP